MTSNSSARALYEQGCSLLNAGRWGEAIQVFERLRAEVPAHPAVLKNLGVAYQAAKRFKESEACFRRGVELEPRDPPAWSNLGGICSVQGRYAEAEEHLRKALALKPDFDRAWYNLGFALQHQFRLEASEAAYRQAGRLAPGISEIWSGLGAVLQSMGRAQESLEFVDRANRLKPEHLPWLSDRLALLNYLPDYPLDRIQADQAEFGAWLERRVPPLPPPPRPAQMPERIRVGYLSGDFLDHSVAFFLEPVLRHHDPRRVEVRAYSFSPRRDAVTEALQGLVEGWTEVEGMDDAALARQIREDGIQVLVDLAGHTVPSRMVALALKPAPVQVAWLGYPAATGLRTIDARLSDRWMDPPSEDGLPGRDRVIRLQSAHAFHALKPLPPVSPSPVLANGFITFGSVQGWIKLNPPMVRRWAAILREIPDSRLVVGSAPLEGAAWLPRLLEEEGIARGRVELRSRHDPDWFHSQLAAIDFLLDSWPYAGTTTTCFALAMGVPTLTLAGDRACSRTCASVLAAAGLEDWIAHDDAGFRAKAAAWARKPEALADLRGQLRERVVHSRLGDGAALARDLEDQYEALVRNWIERGSP